MQVLVELLAAGAGVAVGVLVARAVLGGVLALAFGRR